MFSQRPDARFRCRMHFISPSVLFVILLVIIPTVQALAAAPAFLVKDINPAGSSQPDNFSDLNGALLFAADDGVHGRELWRSDGTATSTYLVTDTQPGPSGSTPTSLTPMNGAVYFAANDGGSGMELWRSDGTAAGCVGYQSHPLQYLYWMRLVANTTSRRCRCSPVPLYINHNH